MNRMRREQWEAQRRARGLSTAPKSAVAAKKSESSRKKAALGALAARHAKKPAPSRRRDVEDIYDDEDDRDDDDEFVRDDDDDEDFGSRRKSSSKRSSGAGGDRGRDRDSASVSVSVRDSIGGASFSASIREPPATYEDIKKCQLTRLHLIKWIGEPYFEKAIAGCYVRIPISGDDPRKPKGTPTYRLAQLTGISEVPKPYTISETDKPVPYRVLATIGHNSRAFGIDQISQQEVTKEEFDDYVKFMKKVPIALPTRREIAAIVSQITEADNYRYSPAEVQQMISNSGFKNVNRHRRRLELQQQRIAAEDQKDKAKIAEVDEQIAALDAEEERERALNSGSTKRRQAVDLDTPKPKPSLFAEVAAITSNPFDPRAGKKTEEKSNPFARRRTLQDSGWAKNLSKAASGKLVDGSTADGEQNNAQDSKPALAPIGASVWDLDLTAESPVSAVPAATTFAVPAPPSVAASKPAPVPAKTLSLADYLAKKGK
eukprot:TRINITY_DN1807_c0_g1_i2.p1 TRINITY_DN1807_c0_g1~~TRINITY_DN1807_c0_g1_i2.p1  ORF type:complete len:488 (-),score=133.23 TRINITY_DN1807_c0_g1_i2:82-1545(-)